MLSVFSMRKGLWPRLFGKYAGRAQEVSLLLALNIPMTVLKTLMHGKAYEMEGFSKQDQHLLFTQEWIRQSISTALWLTSLVASYVVVEKFFPKQSQLGKLLFSNLLSSIPDTFVRPFLTAKLSKVVLGDAAVASPALRRMPSLQDLARLQAMMEPPALPAPQPAPTPEVQPPAVRMQSMPYPPAYGYYPYGYAPVARWG